MTEQEIERASVEQVFALTGGELADKPWFFGYEDSDKQVHSCTRHYWYEGAPEYAARELEDNSHTHRTLIDICLGYGFEAPEEIVDSAGVWKKVAEYASSGESQCPYEDGSGVQVELEACNGPTPLRCALCEEQLGEKHGYVYLGDSREVVYRLVEEEETEE